MELKQEETISAISTAAGEGGIGIVRLSGRTALEIGDKIFRSLNGRRLVDMEDRKMILGHVIDGSARTIDEVMAVMMRAPHSYTCEDVVEFHCHGGLIVLRNVLSRTLEAGARLAERGEFTKRAFLNGRLDLSQAQAVLDIIQSKTDAALELAEHRLAGSDELKELRQKLIDADAHIEAVIDFPEDDLEGVELDRIDRTAADVIGRLDEMLATETSGRIMREGLQTAIIGKPNVGKSSLLNYLLKSERAIVTDIPGTTRDSIEEYADIEGIPLRIIDTAGIRAASDEVERIGIERARDHAQRAELILALIDGSTPLTSEDEEIFKLIDGRDAIILLTKSDLPRAVELDKKFISISIKNGEGLDELKRAIVERAGLPSNRELNVVRDAREADALRRARKHLTEARDTIKMNIGIDFVSIDFRSALAALGELTGETVDEAIIDEIFSKFCVGK
ncbi:MAG: tRNA uridine-5-carboxymethylaminomethyl(34) synthesis GTPase MnmE [Selenomonadaceae bacterium]|nr:tRNA uridine-5-carboxymethylaminomethyl(34) synthesis GTPase MnmE [Selenomonadaceae bacterium]